ncbi:MAG: hypothetical protein AABY15_02870 [Nanoarchaeota archaeon]
MTTQELEEIGFVYKPDMFSKKHVWVIGEEEDDSGMFSKGTKFPLVYYDIEKQCTKINRGEFCVVGRVCKTKEELIKFIESIKFIFEIDDEKLSIKTT